MAPLQLKNLEELKELMVGLIGPIVKEEMKLLNIGRADRRFQLYPTEDQMMGKSTLTPEAADKITRFFRGLLHPDARFMEDARLPGGGALWRDLAIGTGSAGGYLVPTEFRAEIILYLIKKPVLRNIVKVIPIGGKIEVPKVTTRPGMSWPGENAVATGTQPVFGTLTLASKLGLAMVPMSRQLFEHSGVDVIGLLTQLFGDAFGAGEDTVIVNGSGSGQPTGFRTHSSPSSVASVAQAGEAIVGDDIINLYFTLPSQYRGNATWIIHNSIIQRLRTLKDTYGRYLWADGGGFQSAPASLLGRPVLEQNDIPINLGSASPADESEIWFGDFQFYYLGDAETMGVEVTTEGAGTFEKHQVAIKGFEEIDGDVAVEDAFRVLTGAE